MLKKALVGNDYTENNGIDLFEMKKLRERSEFES